MVKMINDSFNDIEGRPNSWYWCHDSHNIEFIKLKWLIILVNLICSFTISLIRLHTNLIQLFINWIIQTVQIKNKGDSKVLRNTI